MKKSEETIEASDPRLPEDFSLKERLGPIIERVQEEIDAMCPGQDVGLVLVVKHNLVIDKSDREIHVIQGLESASTMPRQKAAKTLAQCAVKMMESMVNEIPEEADDEQP